MVKKLPVNNDSSFDIFEHIELIEASFKQDYAIDLDEEWLSKTTIRKFKSLLAGITKDTALGNYFMNKQLSKKDKKMNVKTKEGVDKFKQFAQMFK